jgi:hypothetical protein
MQVGRSQLTDTLCLKTKINATFITSSEERTVSPVHVFGGILAYSRSC